MCRDIRPPPNEPTLGPDEHSSHFHPFSEVNWQDRQFWLH